MAWTENDDLSKIKKWKTEYGQKKKALAVAAEKIDKSLNDPDKKQEIRKTRITNNQAGHVVIDINKDRMLVLVENKAFADNYRNKDKRKWGEASYYDDFQAYGLFQFNAIKKSI